MRVVWVFRVSVDNSSPSKLLELSRCFHIQSRRTLLLNWRTRLRRSCWYLFARLLLTTGTLKTNYVLPPVGTIEIGDVRQLSIAQLEKLQGADGTEAGFCASRSLCVFVQESTKLSMNQLCTGIH